MNKFLKDNHVLVLGVSLPLLLIIVFALAAYLPRLYVDPPQYDFLFITNYYEHNANNELRFRVVDKKLRIEHRENDQHQHYYTPRLYRFNSKSLLLEEIVIDIPAGGNNENWQIMPIDEVANLTLDAALEAPDGYEFQKARRSGGDFLGLFYRGYRGDCVITKNGNTIRIQDSGGHHYPTYYNTKFLGWIIAE